MKLFRIMAAGLAATALGAGVAAADSLRVGFAAEPYPPFTYKSATGDWTGFEVELAEAVCAEMNAECELAPTGWSGIIPALTSGRIDMIMGSMTINAERDEVIDFSQPYYNTAGAFVAPESLTIEGREDLDGLILGVQGATTHLSFAREELEPIVADIRIYDQQEQVNRDLLAGRLDVLLADEIAMAEFVDRDEASGLEIKYTTPPHPAYGEGIGVGVREEDDELTEQLNAALSEVIANGTCAEISMKYFEADICGA
jgi:polar amino acid transport system substrate-binding protein